MSDEIDTRTPPQDSGFSIPVWVWITVSVLLIGIIVTVIVLIGGGSSDEETPGPGEKGEEETPGPGEKGEEEEDANKRTKNFGSYNDLKTIALTNTSDNNRIKTIVEFQIPQDAKEITQLTLQFDREYTGLDSAASFQFQYLLFNILTENKETSRVNDKWGNCGESDWKMDVTCRRQVLYDFSSVDGYDYKFTSADLTFDQSSRNLTGDITFLKELKAGDWVKLLMRIYGWSQAGTLSNIRGTLTYRV